jgi:membrane protease YdiL (CAAX protease family)
MGDLLPGAFWGVVSLSALIGILHALHLLVFDGIALHGIALLRFGLEWLVMFLVVGFAEEYLMRGYLQFTLTRGFYGLGGGPESKQRAVAFWCAAVVMSALFACAHLGNGGENFVGLFMVFIAGIVFSYALWRTGSLWWGIGFHMAWDWAQSFLWGVPDSGSLSYGRLMNTHPVGKVFLSGGSDGPEGSIFVIPIMLLVLLAIRTAKPGVQPPLEAEEPAHGHEPVVLQVAS